MRRSAASSNPTSRSNSVAPSPEDPGPDRARTATAATPGRSVAGRGRRPAARRRSGAVPPPGLRRTSTPATVAWPSLIGNSVHSIRTVVVLPAPFGPRKPKYLPPTHTEVDPAYRLQVTLPPPAPIAPHQTAHLDREVGRSLFGHDVARAKASSVPATIIGRPYPIPGSAVQPQRRESEGEIQSCRST